MTAALRNRLFGGEAGGVFQGMVTLALGAGAARIIGIAAIPVLTRIYGPGDFGALSVFNALVLVLVPLVTLRYLIAIPLPRQNGVAVNLLALCGILVLGVGLVISAAFWAFGGALLSLFSMEELAPYWWMIGLGVMCAGAYETLTMWATRGKAFGAIARSQVLQTGVGDSLKVGVGLVSVTPLGLIVGQVAGQAAGAATLLSRFLAGLRRYARNVRLRHIILVARHYVDFPTYRLPAQFLLAFSIQAPLLFTAAIYDSETTGQLGLALMALALPINLLGQSMSRAYYAELASLGSGEAARIRTVTVSVTKRLFVFSLPIAGTIFLGGGAIFTLAFGNEWRVSGEAASILSIYLIFQFTSSPLLHVLDVLGRQRTFLFIYAQRATIVSLVFLFVAMSELSFFNALYFYSLCLSIHYILVLIRIMHLVHAKSSAS